MFRIKVPLMMSEYEGAKGYIFSLIVLIGLGIGIAATLVVFYVLYSIGSSGLFVITLPSSFVRAIFLLLSLFGTIILIFLFAFVLYKKAKSE
jgi:hypothetical protein